MAPTDPGTDPAEQHRIEIQQRIANGETTREVLSALQVRYGVEISKTTFSRRLQTWGVQRRPRDKSSNSAPIAVVPSVSTPAKKRNKKETQQHVRRAEIEARTQRGETAEQIANALMEQGHDMKSGPGTVLRLQTQWGLIPKDRPKVKKPKVSRRELEREANHVQQTQTLHYPTNCSFGPKKRVNGAAIDDDDDDDAIMDMTMDDSPSSPTMPMPMSMEPAPAPTEQNRANVSAEIMSVDFLVDLANSTLVAANHLKDMLIAYQNQTAAPGSDSVFPPTMKDLATARRKVREAAAVMQDLAAEPTADG